jgi:hypothetical protein
MVRSQMTDMLRTVAVPNRSSGSFGERDPPRGPRDRAPSAYLQFPFFVFRLANPFEGNRECGASIWLR